MLDFLDKKDFIQALVIDNEFITVWYYDEYDHNAYQTTRFQDQMDIALTDENVKLIKEKFGVDVYAS